MTDTKGSTSQSSNEHVQQKDELITQLQKDLAEQKQIASEQKAKNDALAEKVEILFKSADKNKIKENTPKKPKMPEMTISLWDDVVVTEWKKMTKNKVQINDQGMKVEQSTVIVLATGKELELPYDEFHTNRQRVGVRATKVEPVVDEYGQTVDVIYHVTYDGKPYQIHKLFIN